MNSKINKKVSLINWGLVDYQQAWDKQAEYFNAIVEQKIINRDKPENEITITPNYLFLCEHPHVYTLGKSGKREHLLANDQQLSEAKAQYLETNRGGDITYHGPGQLVCYPVLDLDNFFTDIHKYMRFLEEAVILTLAHYGIDGGRIAGLTGVWIDHEAQLNPRKICAMGVKTSRWVTMHGLAINVNTNLDYFKNIIPCGIEDKAVTSMEKEIGKPLDITEVGTVLSKHLISLFEMEV
ncbi:MAG: lipoyl(octanoyl) transferase LipB [Bacteroidota bacterium]|jgi:lipoyl(octanoyl) transferase